MKINEIFFSIQGEGKWTGLPNVFIRTTGCNLRCSYCDTKYAYTNGKEMIFDEILKKISNFSCKNVCITGGEPLEQEEFLENLAKESGRKLTRLFPNLRISQKHAFNSLKAEKCSSI